MNCVNGEIRVEELDLNLSLQKINTNYYLGQLNKTLYDLQQVA